MPREMTVLFLTLFLSFRPVVAESEIPLVDMNIVGDEEPKDFQKYRKILVSPTVNTPEPFEGFGGFCGWPKVCRLQNGDLYVVFSAGFWHASWPAPFDKHGQPAEYAEKLYKELPWLKDWNCPSGGRRMWIRSSDNGKTWTRPKMISIVPGAYSIGDIMQRRDGVMFAASIIQTAYGYRGRMPATPVEFAQRQLKRWSIRSDWTAVLRSDDNGETWREVSRFEGPLQFMASPQTLLETSDGSLLMLTEGVPWSSTLKSGNLWPDSKWVSILLRSDDDGVTWTGVSIIGDNDHHIEEGSLEYLADGSMGFASRTSSAWFQSWDEGKTWSEPRRLHSGEGKLMKKGDHLRLANGVNVILTCGGGVRGQVLYTRDSGKTWIKPTTEHGFRCDPLAYYPDGCVLDDGSILVVGDHQGFKNEYGPYGAEVTAIRFRIKTPEEGEGIELLPIGGEPVGSSR